MTKEQPEKTDKNILDATREMSDWMDGNWRTLAEAVAKFAVFCPSATYVGNEFIRHRTKKLLFCRKKVSQKDIQKGEEYHVKGECFIWDGNAAINSKFKQLTSMQKCKNYMVCHIYGGLSHNPEIFSSTANLVLLPKVLAGLSDHCGIIQDLLAHRAYQMFKWYPQSEGFFMPEYNKDFAQLPWKEQVPDEEWKSDKPQNMEERLRRWAQIKDSIVYQVIEKVKEEKDGITRKDLINKLSDIASNPSVTISSLMSEKGNSYGKLLYESGADKKIRICRDFQKTINELWK